MITIRDKYHKVKTLATQGATEGERQAAQAAMERMEAAHPELKQPAIPSTRLFDGSVFTFFSSGSTTTDSTSNTIHIIFRQG
jgi:hypothetical protein